MSLNSAAQALFVCDSALPGANEDFVIAGWLRLGGSFPVAAAFEPQGFYVYGYEGSLYLQNEDCGPTPDTYIYAILRRTGGAMSLSAVERGSSDVVELGVDAFFGSGAVTAFRLWGDAIFGSSADVETTMWRMWIGETLPSDADLLIERWNHWPQFTDGLAHDWPLVDAGNAGEDRIATTAATIEGVGPPSQVPRHFIIVSDSVGFGGPYLEGPAFTGAWAQSEGVIQAFPAEFVLDGDLAIPGIAMAQHLEWSEDDGVDHSDLGFGDNYIGIATRLADVPPGSFVDIFGGLNDHWSYTPEQAAGSIFGLAEIATRYGCVPTGIGPTTAPSWSTQTWCAAVRALVASTPRNEHLAHAVDPGDHVTGHYGTNFPDGVHPSDAGLAQLTAYAIADRVTFLTGEEPAPEPEPIIAQGASVQPVVGSPAVRVRHRLAAQGLSAQVVVGSPAVRVRHKLTAQGASVQAVVGSPSIASGGTIVAQGVSVQAVVGSPAVRVRHRLAAQGIGAQVGVGSPAVRVRHKLTAQGASVQAVVGSPSIVSGGTIVAQGASVQAVVGSPAVRVRHQLAAQGISAQVVVGSPAIRRPSIVAQGLSAQAVVGSPAVRVRHRLAAQGISAQVVVGSPSLRRQEDEISPITLAAWTPGLRFSVTHRRNQ